MNKVLVVSKGTGQAKAFERVAVAHTEKSNDSVEWLFVTEAEMGGEIAKGDISVAVISPEVMLTEAKIVGELDSANIPHISVKPVDFGTKNMAKIMPQITPHLK